MRTAGRLATCTLVLAGAMGGLVGCGDGDDSSDESSAASKDDFCDAFEDLLKDASSVSGSDLSAQIASVKKGAAKLEDVGAPKDMPEDAQHGLEVFVDAIQSIDDDAKLADLQDLGKDMSAEDQKSGEAFVTWAQTNCVAGGTGSPSPSS